VYVKPFRARQVRAVLVPRHLSRPGAVGIPGRRRDVLHRRRPGVVIQLVVLRSERLEDELGSLEAERDLEVGRDELGRYWLPPSISSIR
jgi:hypothetical protein